MYQNRKVERECQLWQDIKWRSTLDVVVNTYNSSTRESATGIVQLWASLSYPIWFCFSKETSPTLLQVFLQHRNVRAGPNSFFKASMTWYQPRMLKTKIECYGPVTLMNTDVKIHKSMLWESGIFKKSLFLPGSQDG